MPTQGALRALKMEAFGWPAKSTPPVFNLRRCTHGHWHGVFQQKDKNTCGPLALRMALIEMGRAYDTPKAALLLPWVGLTSKGVKVDDLLRALTLVDFYDGMDMGVKLEKANTGTAVHEATAPVIVYCTATLDGKRAGGHWVTVTTRNKRGDGPDTFCVFDSARGTVHDVAIDKTGQGMFSFVDHKKRHWRVTLEKEALKVVEAVEFVQLL